MHREGRPVSERGVIEREPLCIKEARPAFRTFRWGKSNERRMGPKNGGASTAVNRVKVIYKQKMEWCTVNSTSTGEEKVVIDHK